MGDMLKLFFSSKKVSKARASTLPSPKPYKPKKLINTNKSKALCQTKHQLQQLPKNGVTINVPELHERFVVPEGTKKVSYERDTKVINAASFTLEREDHTIGNIVRMQLHRDENVLFAGYKLPHPLQYNIIMRIHTSSQSTPMQAYNQAISDLDHEIDHLKAAFEAEVARVSGEYS